MKEQLIKPEGFNPNNFTSKLMFPTLKEMCRELDTRLGFNVEIGEKPTAWINVSNAGPQGSYHTYESLRRVLSFTGAAVIEDACARIPG